MITGMWHVEAIADSGLRIIFLTMLLAPNQTTIGIHRSHCPQKKDQNTSCRITGFTILLTSVTSVGIWHTFATLGHSTSAPHVEAPLRRGRGWANAAYRDDARFGNRGGGAAWEGLTTRLLGSCMASCNCLLYGCFQKEGYPKMDG